MFSFLFNGIKMSEKDRFDSALLRTVGVKLNYNALIARWISYICKMKQPPGKVVVKYLNLTNKNNKICIKR